jgi:type 1 glutamine amidotransferase
MLVMACTALACARTEGPSSHTTPGDAADLRPAAEGETAGEPARTRLLVFSRTVGFRHDSIDVGIRAIQAIAQKRGFAMTATEDPSVFGAGGLRDIDVVVFLLTSGDILGAGQEAELETFVKRGGGIVGIHSATDTESQWPTWQQLFGAQFAGHPPGAPNAQLRVVDQVHPATRPLAATFARADEWYSFRQDPARDGATRVLVTVDESSYGPPPELRMGHHPISWTRTVLGGRVFYTAMGHTIASYSEEAFLAHLEGGIAWAAGERDSKVVLEELDGTNQVGQWDAHGGSSDFSFEVHKDGLEMWDRGGANQHITRRGLLLDAMRPYSIDTLFLIRPDRPGAGLGFNSFCLNFAVQGEGGSASDLGQLFAHAMNLDVADGGAMGGTMKHMGFVDGSFRQIGQRTTECCRSGMEYRLRVDVNVDAAGSHRVGFVTVTLSEGALIHEHFTVDYRSFPWQPDRTKPLRVGANTHGADWVMRHFRVRYLD